MKKVFFSFLIVVCLFIFNTSCGLDVFYLIESPVARKTISVENSVDDREFEFVTNEILSIEGLSITGTDVYYKISDNYDNLLSDVSYINSNENNNSSRDKLITSGRKFQNLKVRNYNSSVLIPFTGTNKNVKIRLVDNLNSDLYPARILVDNANLTGGSENAVPVRNIPVAHNDFDFTNPETIKPVNDDSDASISSASDEGIYYVALFAVTVGHDAAYTNYFSEPVYLGCIKINSKDSSEN